MCARHGVEPYLPLDSGREKVSRARGCEAPHPRSPPGPSHARSRARAGTLSSRSAIKRGATKAWN